MCKKFERTKLITDNMLDCQNNFRECQICCVIGCSHSGVKGLICLWLSDENYLCTSDAVCQRQVYYIRKATLKTADKRYSSLNNDYEMTFSSETEVSLCDDDDSSLTHIPSVTYNFVPINQLEGHAPNSTVGNYNIYI